MGSCPFAASLLRVVWKNNPLPFHDNAMLAAEVGREIMAQRGNQAFWRYHDTLFTNRAHIERADLERYAQEMGGVDMTRFR